MSTHYFNFEEMKSFFIELDHRLFISINTGWSNKLLDPIFIFLSSNWIPALVLLTAIFYFVRNYKTKFWMPLLLCIGAWLISENTTSKIIKPYFKRLRPAHQEALHPVLPNGKPGGRYGFVSTHSSNAFAIYPLAGLLMAFSRRKNQKWTKLQKKWFWGMMSLAFLVAFSRIYLAAHYPSDIFFGGCFGGLIGFGLYELWVRKISKFTDLPMENN